MYRYDYIQIPQLPLLGPNYLHQIIRNVYEAIVGEATAAEFYSRLLQEAPDDLHREFIEHARDDELEHLHAFIRLYCYLTGQMPQYNITPVVYSSYKEGILMALEDELKAGEFYRNIQLSTTDKLIRDTFYYAMVDELQHATMFSTLYNTI
ncbi:ferritin-like domain-containing protein [Clostridium sp. Cult2]|uniref:ferritin-like domain-containing protein n=1 Tax=Clostridium sp. Cult2 TaxID=2079003 RepID=UPI001F159806|nr:ferritin-like domain-containing protein [Clostridium sp. Cult2]MCF6465509.1 rubrerythrin family protein [Clostridium sp. Cult2]